MRTHHVFVGTEDFGGGVSIKAFRLVIGAAIDLVVECIGPEFVGQNS